MKNIPALIVFDLDFTLWDCGGLWVDCTSPPYHKDSHGRILDSAQREMKLYPDVPEILAEVEKMGCQTALASRTDQPTWASQVLELMEYQNRFDYQEIFPSSKVAHFTNLQQQSGLEYEEMLFFDDEHRNIVEVGALGVKCIEVRRGVNWDAFRDGLKLF